jgi:GntR family transcriptional regulator/MocR family aminotransferase
VQSSALGPGSALPSSRELARDLQISRNTVIHAYDRLIGEGYLEAESLERFAIAMQAHRR